MSRGRSGGRMFVAVLPPDEVVEHLDDFLAVRRAAAPYRWATAEQLHLTLAFLAEVEEWRLDDLVAGLGRTAARRRPFDARIAGGGAFPDVGRARVLWAGLGLDEPGRAELDHLAAGCRTAANRAGVAPDGQRFRPHVTLARTRHPTEMTSWVRLLDTYVGPRWQVDRIGLVASHLGEGPHRRPRYEVVEELELGGRPDDRAG